MGNPGGPVLKRHVGVGLLLGGLLILGYQVLHLFLVPLAWAAILAWVSWPLYARLRGLLRRHAGVSALVMTVLVSLAFLLPMLWLSTILRGELAAAYASVAAYLTRGPQALPGFVARTPWLGDWLQALLRQLADDPAAVRVQLAQWVELQTEDLLAVLGGVGRNAAKLGLAMISLFFLFRDGERLLGQLRIGLGRLLGTARAHAYLETVGSTVSAVVYGLVVSALVQGTLAGLGYWVAGVHAPALLAGLTILVALVPFGTPMVWAPVGVWLLLNGKLAAGAGLLLWGALVVSWVDNLIRPLIISGTARIPFLLVLFGVLGGLAAFGLVGLFLGPVILAVLLAVWREGLASRRGSASGQRQVAHGRDRS